MKMGFLLKNNSRKVLGREKGVIIKASNIREF